MNTIKKGLSKIVKKFKQEWNSLKNNMKKIKEVKLSQLIKDSKMIIMLISIFVLLFGFLFVGIFTDNKSDFINGFKKALVSNKASSLTKYITIDDENVSTNEMESIINYFNGEEEKINKVALELSKSSKSGFFTLKIKDTLFGDKYFIDIKKVKLELNCEIDNVEVELGDEKAVLNKNAVIDIIPGKYDLKYKHITDFGDIEGNMNIVIVEDEIINIDLDANFITLYSNFADSKVYINDIETNFLAEDIKNFGPIPKGKDINLYIEREFPWGRIKSNKVNIDEESYIKLDINMVNDALVQLVENVVNEFYTTSFKGLNERNSGMISNCTDEVKKAVYQYINEKTLLLSNNYEITDLNVEIEKSDFKYEDETYKASVLTKLNYSIYKKILPFLKNQEETHFFLTLEYDGEVFIINEIQKIEL